jgi:uncharacterized protein (TIGR03067 family)
MRALLLFVVFVSAVPDRQDPEVKGAKPLQEQLLGEWVSVKHLVGGVEDKNHLGSTITFTPTEILIREKDRRGPNEDATYVLDSAKKPASIDIVLKIDPTKKIAGIVKVDGDQLTLCFPQDGQGPRPTEFVSSPKTGIALVQLKRVKK